MIPRALAPAFPLPGTNYQASTSALGKPETFVSPPNAGISLREHVALELLTTGYHETGNEDSVREAFKAADLFLKVSDETAKEMMSPERN